MNWSGRIDHVGQHQVVVKATDTAQSPCLRGFLPSLIVQKGQVALDHRSFDLAGRHVVEPEDEVGELTQIAHVDSTVFSESRFSSLI